MSKGRVEIYESVSKGELKYMSEYMMYTKRRKNLMKPARVGKDMKYFLMVQVKKESRHVQEYRSDAEFPSFCINGSSFLDLVSSLSVGISILSIALFIIVARLHESVGKGVW